MTGRSGTTGDGNWLGTAISGFGAAQPVTNAKSIANVYSDDRRLCTIFELIGFYLNIFYSHYLIKN
jgi:hypothetical protein